MVGKSRSNPVTDEQIISHYRESQSVYKTAAAFGIGSTTVHRVLKKHDEPRNGLELYRQNATMFVGQEQQIREMYERGATMKQLREQFGEASTYAFKYALKRAGGTLRENTAPLVRDGEIEKIRQMNADGVGQVGISLALNRSQSFISRTMRKNGIDTLEAQGEKHSRWKGGRYKDGNGYIRAWVAKDDPMVVMALNDSHVLEHRLVMARKLGRPLLRTETIHHIDGNHSNNAPENLQLRQGKHGKHVVMCCLDCGSRNVGHVRLD